MRALIVSSDNPRGSIATARYLARAGWWVGVGTVDVDGPLAWSRATSAVYEVPPPQKGLDAFVTATANAVGRSRSELVLPGSDAELLALSAERDRIPAIVPLAEDAVVRRCVDKLELTHAAADAGLPAVKTMHATEEALATISYPVVVKSRFHWLPEHAADAPSRLEAAICGDEASARRNAGAMARAGAEPLLQEVIEGDPIHVHLVTSGDGAIRGLVQQEGSHLLYPVGAGQRVRSRTVAVDRLLEARLPRLMTDLGWFGFAGLAFLRAADGLPYLIDFNGRIPTALEASAGAGANYVETWAALATGRAAPAIAVPRLGMRYQNLETDLRRALQERRGGLLRDLAGTLGYALGAQHTITKLDDPSVVVRFGLRLLRQARETQRG